MTSKKKKNQPPAKPVKFEKEDGFVNMMNGIGVDALQSQPKKKKTKPQATQKDEGLSLEFDDSNDWPKEFDKASTSGKFTGRKKTTRQKPPHKLKITRDFKPDDILDLHGETKNDALNRVQNRIQTSELGNYQTLLIITGKGINSKEKGGVLGKAVWDWLKHHQVEHPIRFQWAPPFLGGRGAVLVFF